MERSSLISLLGVSLTSNFSNFPRRAKCDMMGGRRLCRSLNFFEAVALSWVQGGDW
jgi:hypothetical protein